MTEAAGAERWRGSVRLCGTVSRLSTLGDGGEYQSFSSAEEFTLVVVGDGRHCFLKIVAIATATGSKVS